MTFKKSSQDQGYVPVIQNSSGRGGLPFQGLLGLYTETLGVWEWAQNSSTSKNFQGPIQAHTRHTEQKQ